MANYLDKLGLKKVFTLLKTYIKEADKNLRNSIERIDTHIADELEPRIDNLYSRIKKVEEYDSSLAMTSDEAVEMFNSIYGNNS